MTDFAFSSAVDLVEAIRNKTISSAELTDLYIERIEKHDGAINAVVVRDFERAREAARAADTRLARGDSLGPLHGLPITVKEAYDVEGLPTTWGVPRFRDNVAASNAEAVDRLKAAGAVVLGKTNVPFNLADFQSFNDIYGTTNNPWDVGRTPGGSSGGSAAALAAGFAGLEMGSDIGGSIRNPAHFCGVYGHKPTWGVVPQQGHALPGMVAPPDIAVVGPMSRSAEDLALGMDVVAGADSMNAAGWRLELPRPVKTRLSQLRVALWPTDERAPVATEVADRVQMVGDTLAKLGATVSDSARPDIDPDASLETYHSLLWGVMSAGLTPQELERNREIARTLSPDDRSFEAFVARDTVQEHGTWVRHHHRRFALRQKWRSFFEDWDILVCPQMATSAFPHSHGRYLERTIDVDGVAQEYWRQIFWSGVITVAHLPSTVFPTGPSATGLPIGLQAVGAEFQDYSTIELTRLLAEEIGGFQRPPGYE